jgi:hypothetical protein
VDAEDEEDEAHEREGRSRSGAIQHAAKAAAAEGADAAGDLSSTSCFRDRRLLPAPGACVVGDTHPAPRVTCHYTGLTVACHVPVTCTSVSATFILKKRLRCETLREFDAQFGFGALRNIGVVGSGSDALW